MSAVLADKLRELADGFKGRKPSRNEMIDAANRVIEWKKENNAPSLWDSPPVMVTATIDDAMGHGLELIHLYAEAAGLKIIKLGLLQPPGVIIDKCNEVDADILGLTVLQLFSDEDVIHIGENLPDKTLFIAGGPAFSFDPDLAQNTRIDCVAKNAAAFLEYVLDNIERVGR